MDKNLKETNRIKIAKIIKNLESRNMKGYYCENKEEACEKVIELLADCNSVSWGGSMSLEEIGIKEKLVATGKELHDPYAGGYGQNLDKRLESLIKDGFLMSTNAITQDGVLLNIDGLGNRVAALCFGPKKVVLVVGYNKIAGSEQSAYERVKQTACIANAIRLNTGSPCIEAGKCVDCRGQGCICSSIVYTRYSMIPDRIHVVLVNEELGY